MERELKVTKPDEIVFTLELTMTLREWKKIKAQLATEWPSWELGDEISNMIRQANAKFWPEDSTKEKE